MMTIAIIEDDSNTSKLLTGYLEKILSEGDRQFRVYQFDTAEKFLYQSGFMIFDIVFFDIELPGMNGMEAAKEFRKNNADAVIVFVTNMAQFALAGYEVSALDFIVKPVNYFDFAMKVKRAIRKVPNNEDDFITIIKKDTHKRIWIRDIYYVEILNHRIIYHTKCGIYDVFGALKDIENVLSSHNFRKCNRCYLVNLRYVMEIRGDEATVGPDVLVISRSQKKEFLKAFTKFCGLGDV